MTAPTTIAIDISTNITNGANNNSINTNLTSMIEDGELVPGQQALAAAMSILTDQISQTKLIASLVLFLITLLCGYLPVRIIVKQDYIQHAMFAGGGVLMATAFCHLIPEAHDSYRALNHHNQQDNHQDTIDHQQQHDHDQQMHQINVSQPTLAPNFQNQTQVLSSSATTISNEMETLISDLSVTSGLGEGSFMAKINGLNVPYLEMTLCCGFFFMYLVEQLMLRFINNHTHDHPCDTGPGQLIIGANTPSQNNANSSATGNSLAGDSNFSPGDGGTGTGASSAAGSTSVGNLSTTIITPSALHHGSGGATELYKFIRGLLIVSAFGMHSIFDGVAIGSQDSVERVWTIFVAISCHKLIIAAVVGLELFAATLESHLWTLVHLIIFSIMSPIGIILVVVAQNSFNISSDHPAMILLQSFATGTLLYIIFVEILQSKEDQFHTKNRIGQSFSLIAGFALMLAVLTLIDH